MTTSARFEWKFGGDHVLLAGTFNGWRGVPVMYRQDHLWIGILQLIPGIYFYKYIVDGIWCVDYEQPTVEDTLGNTNNIAIIKEHQQNILFSENISDLKSDKFTVTTDDHLDHLTSNEDNTAMSIKFSNPFPTIEVIPESELSFTKQPPPELTLTTQTEPIVTNDITKTVAADTSTTTTTIPVLNEPNTQDEKHENQSNQKHTQKQQNATQQGSKQQQEQKQKQEQKQQNRQKQQHEQKQQTQKPPQEQTKQQQGRKEQQGKKKQEQLKIVAPPAFKQNLIFSHLKPYKQQSTATIEVISEESIHPDIISLGLKFSTRLIQGANARCLAMLDAFDKVISDYTARPDKHIALQLDAILKDSENFLSACRPISLGMKNAIKYIKQCIGKTAKKSESNAKQYILARIRGYRKTKICSADKVICDLAKEKIVDGDVVLVYASSHIVQMILCDACQRGVKFRVVVVDSNQKFEGRTMLGRLVESGIKATYVMLTGVSYVMKEVTKVFLGAHAMLSNGTLIGRTGTAVIAMMAHAYHVPVLVACETYKFHERVQLDSICQNELDDPTLLGSFENGKTTKLLMDIEKLKVLNLSYDLTPMAFVQMVVTEVGIIPPTSVPAVIRESDKKTMEAEFMISGD